MHFEFDFPGGKNPLISKTVVLNAVMVLAEVLTLPQLGEIVPAEYRGHIAILSGVANIYLRSKGGAPLDWKAMFEAISPLLKRKK